MYDIVGDMDPTSMPLIRGSSVFFLLHGSAASLAAMALRHHTTIKTATAMQTIATTTKTAIDHVGKPPESEVDSAELPSGVSPKDDDVDELVLVVWPFGAETVASAGFAVVARVDCAVFPPRSTSFASAASTPTTTKVVPSTSCSSPAPAVLSTRSNEAAAAAAALCDTVPLSTAFAWIK